MNIKKFFALVVVAVLLCATVVSAGAAQTKHMIYTNNNLRDEAAVAVYTLAYNASLNCVSATNGIYYRSGVAVADRNFPGYIDLHITMPTNSWHGSNTQYLTTSSINTQFSLEYLFSAGQTPAQAYAEFSTNLNGNGAYTYSYDTLSINIP